MISQVGSTSGTVASGTGFATDRGGVESRNGRQSDRLPESTAPPGATAVIDWIYSEKRHQPRQRRYGGAREQTTVVGRSGTLYERRWPGVYTLPPAV